jgi:nucleoside-diphosphate-sugar epimerase
MSKTVSILGCGWLGTAVGKSLLSKGYVVKGSTVTSDSYNKLETTGIETYHIKIEPGSVVIDYTSFFNTDVLIISFPPARTENITEIYPQQVNEVIQLIQQLKIQKVLFVSSTSVYEATNRIVREGDEGSPEKPAGKAILAAEKMLLEVKDIRTTVVRFGGLIGADRNPARFLAAKKSVPASTPVNLIHRADCVNIISKIITDEIWGELFNACCPEHPTKKEFYAKAAKISELPAPDFVERPENYKIVNSDKLIKRLGYKFEYPSPMDYLKELEEWAYRI